ncbi:bacterioferritin [Endozoicomonas sp. G2_1]|uniref:bacterioferritin n=1 Tax=Endozoicomonas sp. G2_1 TaxID=2821091 RepID=UPI001AD9C575|nr:bacterioferritin [Endozoicomonas sp. G2_1]MBO9491697.1 bacterioferritin [Endozoicomonas sp. G2_1]
MKSNGSVVSTLNKVLTTELTSINRYFLHARMFKNWGFSQLNDKGYKKSILDMKQADKIIERILFLEGLPNLQQLSPLAIGEDTQEMLNCDTKFQLQQIDELKAAVALCEQEQDYVSRDMLTEILEGEEEYLDWLETQQYQIDNMGLAKYLQAQL